MLNAKFCTLSSLDYAKHVFVGCDALSKRIFLENVSFTTDRYTPLGGSDAAAVQYGRRQGDPSINKGVEFEVAAVRPLL